MLPLLRLKTWLKPIVFTLCLLPLAGLVYGAATFTLGANPVEHIIRELGEWALRFLLLGLVLTPLRNLTGWSWPITLRRMIGLYAFFYTSLHLLVFVGADLEFSLSALWTEIIKRKFITVGMIAFVLLLPLAVTSTNKMVKRLGDPAWKKLHKLVYPIALLAVLHFYWMAKADKTEPLIYAAIAAALLLYRVMDGYKPLRRLTRRQH